MSAGDKDVEGTARPSGYEDREVAEQGAPTSVKNLMTAGSRPSTQETDPE